MVLTLITLLIPAFSLLCAPPVLAVWLLRPENAPLPMRSLLVGRKAFQSFGTMLEPRYVVGARALDQ